MKGAAPAWSPVFVFMMFSFCLWHMFSVEPFAESWGSGNRIRPVVVPGPCTRIVVS